MRLAAADNLAWEIDLKARTADTGGFAVKYSPMPAGSKFGSDCFLDPEGRIWRQVGDDRRSRRTHIEGVATIRLRPAQEWRAALIYSGTLRGEQVSTDLPVSDIDCSSDNPDFPKL